MKRNKTIRLVASLLACAAVLKFLPAGAIAAPGGGDYAQATRSYETLKALDGVTLGGDGSVASAEATEENQLTPEEINLLFSGGASAAAPEYEMSADGYLELGLTEDDIEKGMRLHGGHNEFSLEISTYRSSMDRLNAPDGLGQDILKLICSGYACGEAFGAYVSGPVLGMTIDELAAAREAEIENPPPEDSFVPGAEDPEYLEAAARMGVPYAVVEEYMAGYGGSADGLRAEFETANAEFMESTRAEQGTEGPSSGSSLSSSGMGTMSSSSSTYSASASGASATGGMFVADAILTKPHSYERMGDISVDLNDGSYTYTETDLSIPGTGGLDLNITRSFNSEYANSLQTIAFNPWNPMYDPPYDGTYCVQLQYIWLTATTDSDGNTVYIDVTNEGYTITAPIYDFEVDYNPYLTIPFTAEEYDLAVEYKYGLSYVSNTVFAAMTPYGTTVGVSFAPVLVGIYPAFDGYLFNTNQGEPYSYDVDEYGLGHGWRLGFSAIETHATGFIDGQTKQKVLVTSDGRRYAIAGNIGTNTALQTSGLVDYNLLDMRIFKTGNGYPGAAYSLFHKDGRIEYFNAEGRNIAIADRFGNEITLEYEYEDSSKKTVARIDITDTLGNEVVYQNTDPGNYAIKSVNAKRNGASHTKQYNAKWTLSLNGDTIRTYYVLDYRNATSKETYCLLLAVEGETGDMTWIDSISKRYSYNMFTTSSSTSNGSLPVCHISRICYPSGLSVVRSLDSSVTKKAQLSHAGFMEYDGSFKLYMVDGNGATAYAGMITENRQYFIGDYNNDTLMPFGAPYYGKTIEHKAPFVQNLNQNVETTVRLNTFNRATHLCSKTETRTYSPFDEFALTSASAIQAYKNSRTLSRTSVETYGYNANRLPTQVNVSLYNPGSSSVGMAYSRSYTYDNKGNVLTEKLPNGQTVTYTYDAAYSLLLTKSYNKDAGAAITETNTLSGDGKAVASAAVSKNSAVVGKTDYTYDSKGRMTSRKDYPVPSNASNYTEQIFSYSEGSAKPTEIKVPNVKDADGAAAPGSPGYPSGTIATQMTYNTRGLPTSATDRNGNVTAAQYDAAGRVTKVTNPDGTYRQYAYNVTGNAVTETDELGNAFIYTYDRSGNQTGVFDAASGQLISSKKYDSMNLLYRESEYYGNGQAKDTYYFYDNQNRPIETVVRDGTYSAMYRETYAYQFSGSLLKTTKTIAGDADAPSIVTAEYTDNMGRAVKTGRVSGGTEYADEFTYDYVGNRLTERTAYAAGLGLAFSAKWEYDHAGNVTKAYNADNGYATAAYDAQGNKTSETDYAGTSVSYAYDALGRLVKETRPITSGTNAVVKYWYDAAGNVTSRQATDGAQTLARADYEYDSCGQLAYATVYDGAAVDSVTAYTYDAAGNMLSSRAGMASKTLGGAATQYTYDRYGNVLTVTDALGQTESSAYTALGLLISKTDRNGNETTYTYDAMGRVLTETATPPDGTAETVSYQYTATGAVRQEANGAIAVTYAYDALGRVASVTETGGITKAYAYDLGNRRTSLAASKNGAALQAAAYTYDSQGRLKTVRNNGATVATYTYDANGNRASLTYGNGVTETYAYNLANWVTSVTNKKGGTVQSSYSYTYYADGNQQTKTDHTGLATSYAYDGAGRLVSEAETGTPSPTATTYQYDRSGNRTAMEVSGEDSYAVAYAYDANNRLLTETRTQGDTEELSTYRYDPNGNTVSRLTEALLPGDGSPLEYALSPGTPDGSLYSYDARNRLISAHLNGENITYAYRPDGMRASKMTADATVEHVWDGADIIADVSGGAATRYVRGANLILSSAGAATEYYSYNAHGDVVQLTDGTGAVIRGYSYDAFGVETAPAEGDANPFRYCGEYWDGETGTYYLRARYYAPGIGRFWSEDTVKDGLNWYAYCYSSPVMFVDPSGLIGIMPNGTIHMDDTDTIWDKRLLDYKIAWENATTQAKRDEIALQAKRTRLMAGEGNYKVMAEHPLADYYIPNITDKLHGFVGDLTDTFAHHNGDLLWFRNNVDYGEVVDLKENPEFARKPYSYHVIYNGEVIRGDMPGNFAYGYLGKAAGFPNIVLYVCAGIAQQTNKYAPKEWKWIFTSYGDAPGDRAFIDMGIAYYYDYWGNSGYIPEPEPGPRPAQ